MPHPAHFICGRDCKFFLVTKIGKYIVSTIGEYFPDSRVRQIFADSRGKKIEGMGDAWDADYMKKIGYEELHMGGWLYETMVFKAEKSKKCPVCPYTIIVSEDLEEEVYKKPEEAFKGHYKLCEKWAEK